MPAFSTFVATLAVASFVDARPVPSYWKVHRQQVAKREVPQEHSHNPIVAVVRTSLASNNPDQIEDPIFGLLGNAAAVQGAGKITDPDCLQQATADQAFTNAKAASDVAGMTGALQYRALERNTGSVGLQSNACTTLTAVNPEIAAISQHQDPASTGAAATNKAIVLALAKQIASVGGDPQDALATGTFPPGKIGDPTGAGNTCDVADDLQGCIVTQNLLVPDATAAEITAAAGSGGSAATNSTTATSSAGSSSSAGDTGDDCGDDGEATTSAVASATTTASSAAASSSTVSVSGQNLNFGTCDAPEIIGGLGFDGRKEFAFEPANQQQYDHGSADQFAIISQFMCNTLVNSCGLKNTDSTFLFCQQVEAQVGSGVGNGAIADQWNAAFGITTDFANAAGSSGASNSTAASTGASTASTGSASSSGASTASTGSSSSATSSSASAGALDLGTCSNPTIEFGGSFDGRTEQAFAPENPTDFNHGSADGIGVLTSFICQRLQSPCAASQAALTACQSGTTAAAALTGGAAADAFNAALGFTTDFANNPVTDGSIPPSSGAAVASGSASGSGSAVASSSAAAVASSSAVVVASSTSSASSSASTGTGSSSSSSSGTQNFQTFSGTLGGAPPPVTNSGDADRPFEVEGDTFVNVAAALQRSCSVQHNTCADQANAGASFPESACETQETACNAADANITA